MRKHLRLSTPKRVNRQKMMYLNSHESDRVQPHSRPLLKLLIEAGLGSRRQMANAIRNGRIQINGDTVVDFTCPVNFNTDNITIDGEAVILKPRPKMLLMLNKPAGVLSTTKDDRGRKTVIDIIPAKYRNTGLFPIGRLDKNTTGLLLLTNDGELAYQLTHPKFEHEKEYLVRIKDKLSTSEKLKVEHGIPLDDGITYPARIKESSNYPPFNYSITIHEGRKRQIHRMFANLGHRVLALKRIRLAGLSMGNLKEGEVRKISKRETERLLPGPHNKTSNPH